MSCMSEAVATEVRAEMARDRHTVTELALVLGLSYKPAHERYIGKLEFGINDLDKVAAWLGVPVTGFFPPDAEEVAA